MAMADKHAVTRKLAKRYRRAHRHQAGHLLKHQIRLRPDQLPEHLRSLDAIRPWWIRAWRCIATPWRQSRRRLLVLIGVRRGEGHASSEHEPEQAMRRDA